MKKGGITFITRLAYGGGDASFNIIFGMISTILTLFYTDYAGIPATTVGIVMMASRVFDGLSDFTMGYIVEKTHSKWGKCRPWLLWSCVPYGISAVLLFTVPHTTGFLQGLYMFVTYNFCTTVCYTAMNIPYGTLASLMSREQYERDMLSIYRKGIAPFGRILGVSCTLPLVKVFGGDQAAWIKTMCLWAAIAILLSLFCFVKCEEKVHIAAKKEQKVPLKKSLKALFTNKYFYAGTCFQLFESMVLAITGTMLPYYCKYVFHNDSWLYSAMYFVETGLMIFISMIICPKLLKRYGKRTISLFGVFFALAGHMIVFVNPYSVELIIASCIIRGIGFAPINAVFYGFIAEAVEYGQWKSHVRQEGMVYAGCTMGMKFGSGLTSLVLTGLLSLGGYISSTGADIVQPASAIDMIINIYKFGPIIMWIAYIILLLLYKLEKRYPIIIQELEEREARGEL